MNASLFCSTLYFSKSLLLDDGKLSEFLDFSDSDVEFCLSKALGGVGDLKKKEKASRFQILQHGITMHRNREIVKIDTSLRGKQSPRISM